jgi:hypothetical protein
MQCAEREPASRQTPVDLLDAEWKRRPPARRPAFEALNALPKLLNNRQARRIHILFNSLGGWYVLYLFLFRRMSQIGGSDGSKSGFGSRAERSRGRQRRPSFDDRGRRHDRCGQVDKSRAFERVRRAIALLEAQVALREAKKVLEGQAVAASIPVDTLVLTKDVIEANKDPNLQFVK